MKIFTIQVKVIAVVEIEKNAESLADAANLEIDWAAILLEDVCVADGQYKIVGLWENGQFDNLVI